MPWGQNSGCLSGGSLWRRLSAQAFGSAGLLERQRSSSANTSATRHGLTSKNYASRQLKRGRQAPVSLRLSGVWRLCLVLALLVSSGCSTPTVRPLLPAGKPTAPPSPMLDHWQKEPDGMYALPEVDLMNLLEYTVRLQAWAKALETAGRWAK